MEEKEFYKNVISTFGKNAFEHFCSIALESENRTTIHYSEPYVITPDLLEVGYYDFTNPYPHNGKNTYFINYLPINLLSRLNFEVFDISLLIDSIKKYMSLEHDDVDFFDEYCPLVNMGIITNISHMTEDYFFKTIAPFYIRSFEEHGLELEPNFSLQLGTIDSILEATTIEQIRVKLNHFFDIYKDGISINLGSNGIVVNEYTLLQELSLGGTSKTFSPLEVIKLVSPAEQIFIEFEKLLNSNTTEKILEDFLKTYFQTLFPTYDAISTQLWVRFPEIDISHKERRLDIFMRNAATHDWDLFELKKANVQLVKGNDIPMFRTKVIDSILQLKTYEKLLSQNHVKQILAEEGIKYAEPNYCLVIGRDPQIGYQRWRWLQTQIAQKNLKIKTYDEVLREAKAIYQKFTN